MELKKMHMHAWNFEMMKQKKKSQSKEYNLWTEKSNTDLHIRWTWHKAQSEVKKYPA